MLINLTGDRISNNVAPIFLRKEPAVSTAQTKINRLRLLPVARQMLFINGQSVAASDWRKWMLSRPLMAVFSPKSRVDRPGMWTQQSQRRGQVLKAGNRHAPSRPNARR